MEEILRGNEEPVPCHTEIQRLHHLCNPFFVLSHKHNLSSVHKKTKQCPLLFPRGLKETKAIQTNLISQLNEHS